MRKLLQRRNTSKKPCCDIADNKSADENKNLKGIAIFIKVNSVVLATRKFQKSAAGTTSEIFLLDKLD